VLLAVLLFVVMSPGTPAPAPPPEPPPPAKAPPAPKPVDVSGLEREGHKLCEEGLAIIRAQEPLFSKELTEAQKHQLKDDLKKGIDLIQKGMGMLSEANEKSGRTYDTTRYGEARKAASMKYHELK
jgi:hypothetical protein